MLDTLVMVGISSLIFWLINLGVKGVKQAINKDSEKSDEPTEENR